MDKNHVLIRQLADGRWHSGEAVAEVLGVSRAAVWKRLRNLESLGLQFESQAGKGYRLAQPLELLDASKILEVLNDGQSVTLKHLEVLSEVDSTNRYLAEAAARHEIQAPALCLAEFQSAGRGRRGREWLSPFGANLYASFLWRFEDMPADLPALSLAVGVSVAGCLRAMGFANVGLKWPNDLWAGGRKLGGILIEHRGETGGPCQVVVGLGLNYAMLPSRAAAVDQPWVSLSALAAEAGRPLPGRNVLAAAVASALLKGLADFEACGFESFRLQWADFDICLGKVIRIEQQGVWQEGESLGVDRDGALLVRMRGERQRFVSGDVSLRPVSAS